MRDAAASGIGQAGYRHDYDSDGRVDMMVVDEDSDGRFDTTEYDRDSDVDKTVYDRDGDGRPDPVIAVSDRYTDDVRRLP